MRAIRRFTVRVTLPEPLAPLRQLMLNLRWSWHQPATELFASIDEQAWRASGGDPVAMLSLVPPERIAELAADPEFTARVRSAASDLEEYLAGERWYGQAAPEPPEPPEPPERSAPGAHAGRPRSIAYFSPEYGITAALPQYSGGLGILAGDHLKAASDLGVPLIGVGLLYRHGYFTQSLTRDGWQAERYPADDPNGLPLELLRYPAGTGPDAAGPDGTGREAAGPEGEPVLVSVRLDPGRDLTAQVWLARVGRVPLLLLDSYVDRNDPDLRPVTDRLYGGGSEHRLRQELLLGIGGVRAVRAFCSMRGHPAPEVFHTNEGHAGFLGLERIGEYLERDGLGFDEALAVTRAGTVFTTHTPVPAGIDRFPRHLIERFLAGQDRLPADQVLALGAETYPGGDPDVFNMAVMGMRLAQRVNGVSRLHGQVSREMFAGLWPGFDSAEVPVGSVTNGVHTPSWTAPEILDAGSGPEAAAELPAARLGAIRDALRARLVTEARLRLRRSWRQRGVPGAELAWTGTVLDPGLLTIGFARRVPSYKRLTLMLSDPERLAALLTHPDRPVQIVVAGKAHPADEGGKRLIQRLVQFADDERVRDRIVFLPDYDMALARYLVQGCDVWLNNPLRPLEACGTSGMKSALNGGLNCSVRDGWWDEWYDGGNGWAIPSAAGVTDPARRDALEAAALYDLIEDSVAPLFYDRDPDGLAHGWLDRIRHSLRTLGPRVRAERMVRDYVTGLYTPAALSSRRLAAEDFGAARELAAWTRRVRQGWPGVKAEHVTAGPHAPEAGSALLVTATIALGELDPGDVTVQAVYGRPGEDDELAGPRLVTLTPDHPAGGSQHPGTSQPCRYKGSVPLDRPGAFGYTIRVLPSHPLLGGDAELGLVAYPDAPEAMTNGTLR